MRHIEVAVDRKALMALLTGSSDVETILTLTICDGEKENPAVAPTVPSDTGGRVPKKPAPKSPAPTKPTPAKPTPAPASTSKKPAAAPAPLKKINLVQGTDDDGDAAPDDRFLPVESVVDATTMRQFAEKYVAVFGVPAVKAQLDILFQGKRVSEWDAADYPKAITALEQLRSGEEKEEDMFS
jgi:hypothetical protein